MPPEKYDWKRTTRGLLLLVAIYLIVVYAIPRPAAVKPEGWRLAGIFFATVAGLIAQPLSGGAIVLIGVTLSAVLGGLTIEQALAGYADKSVWLVMAAIMISRGYGGGIRLSEGLHQAGVTRAFAEGVGKMLSGLGWMTIFLVALVIYFYAHYAFASITAHLLAMFPPFLAVLLAKGAPIGMMVFAFACFANFSAGLTNYGTTPTPLFFGQGYVSLKEWWRIGFVVSLFNLLIWMTFGFGWWKLIHIW
jgi:di/tricarboxylate transporter